MDTFFEQIISIKMTAQKKTLCAALIIAAAAITVLSVLGALKLFQFMFLFVLVVIGVWFGIYKIIGNMNVEYEYIITNGDLDVDLIINKSSRKRIATVNCKEIEGVQKYNFANKDPKAIVCCNEGDEAYIITARNENRGVIKLVIAPNEKIKSAIVKYMPRILVKDAFI